MGIGSARVFERGDTGRLIGGRARWQARVDVCDAKDAIGVVFGRVKERVEDAARGAELKLQARPLADLQRRVAEMPDQLLCRQAGEAGRARAFRLRDGRGLGDHGWRFHSGSAGSKTDCKGENQATHG